MQALKYFKQILEGLGFMHNIGMFHRDIKPQNLLVINERQVRIGDLGVALLPGAEPTVKDLQTGVGTMDYMAPEVFMGEKYKKSSDIYLTAVSFYELITGTHPFSGKPIAQLLDCRKTANIPHLSSIIPDIPKFFNDAIMKALSFESENRFQTISEILNFLDSEGKNPSNTSPTQVADTPVKNEVDPQALKSAAPSPEPVKQKTQAEIDEDFMNDLFDEFLDDEKDLASKNEAPEASYTQNLSLIHI